MSNISQFYKWIPFPWNNASGQTKLLTTKEVFYKWSSSILQKLIFKGASAVPTPTQGNWYLLTHAPYCQCFRCTQSWGHLLGGNTVASNALKYISAHLVPDSKISQVQVDCTRLSLCCIGLVVTDSVIHTEFQNLYLRGHACMRNAD